MDRGKTPAQPVAGSGHEDQMHVVGHQAERETGHVCCFARVLEQAQIQRAIGIREKHLLSPIPTLRDMVGESGNDHAGESSHWDGQCGDGTPRDRRQVRPSYIGGRGSAYPILRTITDVVQFRAL
jgi:hypothetical protein